MGPFASAVRGRGIPNNKLLCWEDHCSWFLYLDKPKITSFSSDQKNNISPVGKTVTIICVADAFPKPNYVISHNGMKLTHVVNGVQTIQSANLSDDGRYECVVNNSLGNVSASFSLTVNGKICVKTDHKIIFFLSKL